MHTSRLWPPKHLFIFFFFLVPLFSLTRSSLKHDNKIFSCVLGIVLWSYVTKCEITFSTSRDFFSSSLLAYLFSCGFGRWWLQVHRHTVYVSLLTPPSCCSLPSALSLDLDLKISWGEFTNEIYRQSVLLMFFLANSVSALSLLVLLQGK